MLGKESVCVGVCVYIYIYIYLRGVSYLAVKIVWGVIGVALELVSRLSCTNLFDTHTAIQTKTEICINSSVVLCASYIFVVVQINNCRLVTSWIISTY
jgi:hypothetical protein